MNRMNIMRWPRRASRTGEHTCPACGLLRPRDDELLWEVRDGGTPSPAPETGVLPSNVKTAGWPRRVRPVTHRMSSGRTARVAVLLSLAIAPTSNFGAAKNPSVSPQLAGYKAVRVHYGPMNQMIMSVRINGQFANLLVDTGSNEIILDTNAAARFGVGPSPRGVRYVGFTEINGQLLPVAFMQSLTAGSMNFGSNPVVLRDSPRSGTGKAHVDGVLGLQILLRHKAVINCRTRLVFFKVDQSRHMNLSAVASSEKFTRVPIHREASGALTVPCSIHGQSGRLLVDTGAFVTTFPDTFFKSLGISSEPTWISARFPTGTTQRISAAQIDDLTIGDFKVPAAKFGVAALPRFALRQGGTRISGILGMDTLYICHAIIDLDGMNLFLK